jgi:hypothetical protein
LRLTVRAAVPAFGDLARRRVERSGTGRTAARHDAEASRRNEADGLNRSEA